jgi:hypothetical protein
MARIVLSGVVVALGAIGAATWYLNSEAPPACGSEQALHAVTGILRDQFRLDGVFVNNIATVSGGLFGDRRECSAEVAAIRGNVAASDMPWRSIHYQIEQRDGSGRPIVSVQLGGNVPLANQAPSFWERLIARF